MEGTEGRMLREKCEVDSETIFLEDWSRRIWRFWKSTREERDGFVLDRWVNPIRYLFSINGIQHTWIRGSILKYIFTSTTIFVVLLEHLDTPSLKNRLATLLSITRGKKYVFLLSKRDKNILINVLSSVRHFHLLLCLSVAMFVWTACKCISTFWKLTFYVGVKEKNRCTLPTNKSRDCLRKQDTAFLLQPVHRTDISVLITLLFYFCKAFESSCNVPYKECILNPSASYIFLLHSH